MLMQAKQEVPSLELGPPSPSWMDQLVGSPPGEVKPATCHETPRSLGPVCAPIRIHLVSSEPAVTCDNQSSSQSRHRPVAIRNVSSAICETSAKLAGATSCESRKRAKTSSEASSKRYAKKRRVVPSGEETTTTDLEKWSTALSADALSETFLAPSTMDMERDATEEFMNEFWGDLMLETSPLSNDNLIAAASSFDEPQPALPTAEPDSHLLDDVTEDQLLELAQFLEPGHPEVLSPASTEAPQQQPVAPATAECPVSAPIDLAALLEETEIVFSPELMSAAEPAAAAVVTQTAGLLSTPPPPPPPPAPTAPAEPTHYLLVLSSPEHGPTPAAPSVSSESTDDPEFALDDTLRSWSTSTEAETEEEVLEVARTSGASRKRAPRRPPAATPAEKYRRIRDTNNEASRRSRQQRKQREVDTQARAAELEEENARLRQKAEVLESLLEQVKALAPLLTAKR